MRFKRETSRVVVILAAVLACAHVVRAQQLPEASAQLDGDGRWVNGVTESWWPDDGITSADLGAAAARWKEIGDELARGGGEGLAGDYFRGGDTHGTYMRWSPRAGFVIARVDKCRAAVMGIVHGRVEATPGLVQFFPEFEKQALRSHGQHAAAPRPREPRSVIRYVPVRWRGERMLVSEGEMEGFGDYAAGLGEYNGYDGYMYVDHTTFFSRLGVEEDAARPGDAPVVPPGYERFIKRPIEARVTAVGRRVLKRDFTVEGAHSSATYARASLTHVVISAGSEQGVKEGLVFRVKRPDEGGTVVITRAGRRTSEAVVVREVDGRGVEYFHDSEYRARRRSRVARGWRLTTSIFD